MKPITPAQLPMMPVVTRFGELLDEAQAEYPSELRGFRIFANRPQFDEAAQLVAPLGIAPEYNQIDGRQLQAKLDDLVTPEDAQHFFKQLPWADFKLEAPWNVLHTSTESDFHRWMVQLGYAHPSWALHTYPSFEVMDAGPIWQALMEAAAQANVAVIARIEFDSDEEQHLTRYGEQLYYFCHGLFYPATKTSQTKLRYIDADDRPGQIPPDGNGWRERTRVYTLAPAVQGSDLNNALLDARDLAVALSDFDPAYLAALSGPERESRAKAELQRYRAQRRGEHLVVSRDHDGLWHAAPPYPTRGEDELETL